MNEMAVESRQRSMVSDHATAELMCLKTQLQQTSSQLSDAQQILAGKVSRAVYTQCNLLYNPLYNQLHHVDICPTCCTVGLRTGCIVYTDIQPIVQLVVQWVVSCKRHIDSSTNLCILLPHIKFTRIPFFCLLWLIVIGRRGHCNFMTHHLSLSLLVKTFVLLRSL